MSIKKTATVRMEEGYMRLTMEYNNPSFKTDICQQIAKLEKGLDIYPEVIHRRDNAKRFFTSVEFSGDDYTCSRSCGTFIESIIQELDLKKVLTD
jgi:hypothetical protein